MDRLTLVVPTDHALASEPQVTLRETLDYQHICLREGTSLLNFLRDQVERLGATLNLRIQLSSFEAVCRMVEAKVGIGILPESAAQHHGKSMAIKTVRLEEPWALRERNILVRDLEALPESVRALVRLLQQSAKGEVNREHA